MASEKDKFGVNVIYALPNQQKVIHVMVSPGTSFIEAVMQSNICAFFPEIDLNNIQLGSFSRQVKPDDEILPGNRVEIYRPLIADPKEVRRLRAEKAKDEGRANKITGGRIGN